jgi:hypothetical protein
MISSIFGDETTMYALRKQTFERLKGMRLVILEDALGSRSRALAFEKQLQERMDKRGEELMGKKGGKKGDKGSKEKERNKQKQAAQDRKKGKKD